jgi:hypothetical protein
MHTLDRVAVEVAEDCPDEEEESAYISLYDEINEDDYCRFREATNGTKAEDNKDAGSGSGEVYEQLCSTTYSDSSVTSVSRSASYTCVALSYVSRD